MNTGHPKFTILLNHATKSYENRSNEMANVSLMNTRRLIVLEIEPRV